MAGDAGVRHPRSVDLQMLCIQTFDTPTSELQLWIEVPAVNANFPNFPVAPPPAVGKSSTFKSSV